MSHRTHLISIAAGALALAGTLLLWPAGAALAAITFQSSATGQNGNALTLVINKPASVGVGNFLLAQITYEKGTDNTVAGFQGPSGWTLLFRTDRGTDIGQAVFFKFAVASDVTATSYTWTFSQSLKAAGGILRYTGVDDTSPIAATSVNTGESNPLTALSVNASVNSRLVTFFGVKKTTNLSNPSGMTSIYQVQNPQDITSRASDEVRSTAGATGNRTSTATEVEKWVAQLLVLLAAPDPLQVSKTASPSFTRTVTWDIDKSVEPASLDLFEGDSGTSTYTIDVTKNVDDSNFAVSGTITITNPSSNSFVATITGVSDTVSGAPPIIASVACTGEPTFPHSLNPGDSLNCTYSASLPNGDTRTNTATVTTSGAVAGNQGTAQVNFAAVTPTVVGFGTVSVNDDNDGGDFGPISASTKHTYDVTYTCDADQGTQDNTATITETEQSDSASVTVNCYELGVTKDVETEFTRTWEWTIGKLGDQTQLNLASGEPFLVNYTVTVEAESQDSDHAISGTITIHNPAPIDASITNVTDQVNGTSVTVNCPGNFPQTLAAGEDLVCDYEGELDNGDATENTAKVTIQNTPSGTTDFTGSISVAFDEPTTEIDECVDVSDSEDTGNVLPAEACAPDPAPFEYARFVGPFEQCGEQQAVNTASFISKDTGAEDESNYTVTATVEGCGGGGDDGCTLSQGYWKTHSSHGPAPYDATWDGLENTTFFAPNNTQTFYQVLWTAPKGNAYYILAHQYIAAQLNELNDANFEDAQPEYDGATALFGQYTPAQIALLKSNNAVRQQFISYAGTLGNYNGGITGPGHCDEDGTSAP